MLYIRVLFIRYFVRQKNVLTSRFVNVWHGNLDIYEWDQLRVNILLSMTQNKKSYMKGFHHHENYPKL